MVPTEKSLSNFSFARASRRGHICSLVIGTLFCEVNKAKNNTTLQPSDLHKLILIDLIYLWGKNAAIMSSFFP